MEEDCDNQGCLNGGKCVLHNPDKCLFTIYIKLCNLSTYKELCIIKSIY